MQINNELKNKIFIEQRLSRIERFFLCKIKINPYRLFIVLTTGRTLSRSIVKVYYENISGFKSS